MTLPNLPRALLVRRMRAAAPELYTALIDTAASLTAAVSLLERGGKKAAPSDRMFDQMLVDYNATLGRARAALALVEGLDHAR